MVESGGGAAAGGGAACGDVLVVAYNAQDGEPETLLRAINDSGGGVVCALDVVRLPAAAQLEAGKAAAQRGYHYLLPLRWLAGGAEAAVQVRARAQSMHVKHGLSPPKMARFNSDWGQWRDSPQLARNGELASWVAEANESDGRVTTAALWREFGVSPKLKFRTPAHTKQLGWYLEFEFRVTQASRPPSTPRGGG